MTFSSIVNIEAGIGSVDRSTWTVSVLGLEGTHCTVVSPPPPVAPAVTAETIDDCSRMG